MSRASIPLEVDADRNESPWRIVCRRNGEGLVPVNPADCTRRLAGSVLKDEHASFSHACKRSRQISGARFPGIWMFDYPRSSCLLFTSLTCLLFK